MSESQEPMVNLDDVVVRADQFDRIERRAARTGVDRSTVVQRLLDLGLAYAGDDEDDEAQP